MGWVKAEVEDYLCINISLHDGFATIGTNLVVGMIYKGYLTASGGGKYLTVTDENGTRISLLSNRFVKIPKDKEIPHKLERIAYAWGIPIEIQNDCGRWVDCESPTFSGRMFYRVKNEVKAEERRLKEAELQKKLKVHQEAASAISEELKRLRINP